MEKHLKQCYIDDVYLRVVCVDIMFYIIGVIWGITKEKRKM